jgi:ribA/ribD-fused uncharacterized protein
MLLRCKNILLRNIINKTVSVLRIGLILFPPIPEDNRILFFQRDRDDFPFLSNFYGAPVKLDGEIWPTVEHYYQARKSFDEDYRRAVRTAKGPGQAKHLGSIPSGNRKVSKRSWFRKNPSLLRDDWEDVKLKSMEIAVEAKFTQHAGLAKRLLATYPAELVEDSTKGGFWGVGKEETGQNMLGRILMKQRERLVHQHKQC